MPQWQRHSIVQMMRTRGKRMNSLKIKLNQSLDPESFNKAQHAVWDLNKIEKNLRGHIRGLEYILFEILD